MLINNLQITDDNYTSAKILVEEYDKRLYIMR